MYQKYTLNYSYLYTKWKIIQVCIVASLKCNIMKLHIDDPTQLYW